jgi:molybdopterin-synthase adenylyltransferase
VELSNLHRQIIYRSADVGRRKVHAAAVRITDRYPEVSVSTFDYALSASCLPAIFPQFDFVIDGTDGIAAKYLVNDGAVLQRIAFSHAGVMGFQGQTLTVLPGQSACLRCLFPAPAPAEDVVTCREAGVLGSLTGILGSLQAAEAVKYLLGNAPLLADRLLTYDALRARWREVAVARTPACPLCGLRPTIVGPEVLESDRRPCT